MNDAFMGGSASPGDEADRKTIIERFAHLVVKFEMPPLSRHPGVSWRGGRVEADTPAELYAIALGEMEAGAVEMFTPEEVEDKWPEHVSIVKRTAAAMAKDLKGEVPLTPLRSTAELAERHGVNEYTIASARRHLMGARLVHMVGRVYVVS